MKLGNPLIYNVNEVELEERSPAWYAKPIKRKLMRRDSATGALHVLNAYPPGLNGPAHRHNCAHTMLILRGQMLINGKPYGPGTYAYFPPGETMVHTTPPDQECAFLLLFDSAPEFIVEGGKTYKIT